MFVKRLPKVKEEAATCEISCCIMIVSVTATPDHTSGLAMVSSASVWTFNPFVSHGKQEIYLNEWSFFLTFPSCHHIPSLSLNLLTGNRVRCPSVNLSRNLRKLQITPLSQCISFLLSSLCGKLFFYLRPLFPWKVFRFYVRILRWIFTRSVYSWSLLPLWAGLSLSAVSMLHLLLGSPNKIWRVFWPSFLLSSVFGDFSVHLWNCE